VADNNGEREPLSSDLKIGHRILVLIIH